MANLKVLIMGFERTYMHAFIHTCIHTHIHVCMHVYTHKRTNALKHERWRTYTHTVSHVCNDLNVVLWNVFFSYTFFAATTKAAPHSSRQVRVSLAVVLVSASAGSTACQEWQCAATRNGSKWTDGRGQAGTNVFRHMSPGCGDAWRSRGDEWGADLFTS